MGFVNPILGGGGALVRAAIKSPNYLTGSTGWAIKRDGSAEFNNVVIRGGTVVSGLALYYNGTPAAGNLIMSISATAGADAFGNAYPAGLMVQDTSTGSRSELTSLGTLRVTDLTMWDNAASLSVQSPLSAFGLSTILQSATNNTPPGDAATALVLDPGTAGTHGRAQFTSPGTGIGVDLEVSGNVEVGSVDIGRGVRSQVSITANISGITTTEVVLMTLPSMTFENGRAYRVTLWGLAQSSTASTYFLYRIRKGSATTSGTIYKDQLRVPILSLANTSSAVGLTFLLVNATGADITTALTWTGSCAAGTGIFSAAAANVATATVEDVGLASQWPGQPIS